ncbi:site-specific integrase [Poseidonibacter lekithochrous]|uniref:tyrosine-type recombinase/integrase n=1 Tax=Poseidonibacter TaxID=2321187 RepID=UPI001C08AE5D|nr:MULTISPECIES: site-specific integrase [Poseidonibacter]MBU3014747.1 site-specific integrase [Poseidonibacter lekithochrous]MDO6828045.1 site-specific integrase [Poseidonibacter sp. 1_MG-2023]
MKVSKGTLFKRKNSPFLYLNISVNGKRYIQKTKYYHNELDNVKKDILPYLRQKIINGEILLNIKEEKVKTFEYYSNCYLNTKKYLKHSTLQNYTNTVIKLNILFGSLEINKINTSEIKNYLYSLNVKTSAFKLYLGVFKGIFNEALQDDVIIKNPCSNIFAPRNKVIDIEPFTSYEVDLILSNANGYFKNFLATAFYTGARTGELFALKWQNIDFINKRIYINATRGDYAEGSPKNGKNRYIPLFDILIPYLQNQKKITGLKTYVFLTDNYCNLLNSNLNNHKWYPLLKRLNIPKKVIYNTRHTFATNMIKSQKFSLNQISAWLGHKDLRMLILHYNKFIPSEMVDFDSKIDIFSNKNCNSLSITA